MARKKRMGRNFTDIDGFLRALSGCVRINENCEVTRQKFIDSLSKEELLIASGFQSVAHLCAHNGFIVPFDMDILLERDCYGRTVVQLMAEAGKLPEEYMTEEILDLPVHEKTVRHVCAFAGILPPEKEKKICPAEKKEESFDAQVQVIEEENIIPRAEKLESIKNMTEFRALSYEERLDFVRSQGEEFLLKKDKNGNSYASLFFLENSLPVDMLTPVILESPHRGKPLVQEMMKKGIMRSSVDELGKVIDTERLNAYDRAYLTWAVEKYNGSVDTPVTNDAKGWRELLTRRTYLKMRRIIGKDNAKNILTLCGGFSNFTNLEGFFKSSDSNGKPIIEECIHLIKEFPPEMVTQEILSIKMNGGKTVQDYLVENGKMRTSLSEIQQAAEEHKLTDTDRAYLRLTLGKSSDDFIRRWEEKGTTKEKKEEKGRAKKEKEREETEITSVQG